MQMVLFRLLLLFLLFYLLIRLIGRILFGYQRNPVDSSGSNFNTRKKKEGDVFIDHQPAHRKKIIDKEEGEYVKYEEVKDDDK